jgi:NTP pyrophosphatase (non-canonical NTP hydrolase)
MNTVAEAIAALVEFRNERDWEQFHTPRNLAAAIAIEAAELQETMLWKSDNETQTLLESDRGREEIADEVADVLIFTLLFCNATNVDPLMAVKQKIEKNAAKYPTHLAKGNAAKYTDLHESSNDH